MNINPIFQSVPYSVIQISAQLGVNNGKGYSQPYVYKVLSGEERKDGTIYENEFIQQLGDLFYGVLEVVHYSQLPQPGRPLSREEKELMEAIKKYQKSIKKKLLIKEA